MNFLHGETIKVHLRTPVKALAADGTEVQWYAVTGLYAGTDERGIYLSGAVGAGDGWQGFVPFEMVGFVQTLTTP